MFILRLGQGRLGIPCFCPFFSCLLCFWVRRPCWLRHPTQVLCWQDQASSARGPALHLGPQGCGSTWPLRLR